MCDESTDANNNAQLEVNNQTEDGLPGDEEDNTKIVPDNIKICTYLLMQ